MAQVNVFNSILLLLIIIIMMTTWHLKWAYSPGTTVWFIIVFWIFGGPQVSTENDDCEISFLSSLTFPDLLNEQLGGWKKEEKEGDQVEKKS